jgi:hypothetical protein
VPFVPGHVACHRRLERHAGLAKRGYKHLAIAERNHPSRLKTWLNDTHHGQFICRLNRRFYPFNTFCSLLGVAGGVAMQSFTPVPGRTLHLGVWVKTGACSGVTQRCPSRMLQAVSERDETDKCLYLQLKPAAVSPFQGFGE